MADRRNFCRLWPHVVERCDCRRPVESSIGSCSLLADSLGDRPLSAKKTPARSRGLLSIVGVVIAAAQLSRMWTGIVRTSLVDPDEYFVDIGRILHTARFRLNESRTRQAHLSHMQVGHTHADE